MRTPVTTLVTPHLFGLDPKNSSTGVHDPGTTTVSIATGPANNTFALVESGATRQR
jgi:hypothetical protein